MPILVYFKKFKKAFLKVLEQGTRPVVMNLRFHFWKFNQNINFSSKLKMYFKSMKMYSSESEGNQMRNQVQYKKNAIIIT